MNSKSLRQLTVKQSRCQSLQPAAKGIYSEKLLDFPADFFLIYNIKESLGPHHLFSCLSLKGKMSMHVEFGVLERAVASLQEGLARPPANDLERDGVIQRFEYTFELTWKTSKRVLDGMGIKSNSPRSVIRDLANQGFISDASAWLEMLHARNYTSHIYNESVAKWVFSVCSPFLLAAEKLILKLKAEVGK